MSTLAARIAGRARRFGPLRWSAFMELALYDEEVGGFYARGGRAGRSGDFVTSPEIGPLFAAVVGRALDQWWEGLGRPDPFVVVEAAAGTGTLARDVLAATPACAPALRYVLVERSAALRAVQRQVVAVESPALVLGPAAPGGADADDEAVRHVPGSGPLVTSLAELPVVGLPGVVLANELLDNLEFDLLEWRDGRWQEVLVAAAAAPESAADGSDGDRAATDEAVRLTEVLVPAAADTAAEAERLVGPEPLAPGSRIPLQHAARSWLAQALRVVDEGRVVVVDYADVTPAMAGRPWPSWLRTFAGHRPGRPPLDDPGSQDITCVVAVDQLASVRAPAADRSQADWLRAHGIEELVEAARQQWWQRAALGDLEAMRARSRVSEAEALTDPSGLGAFRVLEWTVP